MKLLGLLLICAPLLAVAHDHAPSEPHSGHDTEISVRAFKEWANINWMADIQHSKRDHEDDHKAYTIGGKYRLFTNLKVGLSVSRQYGNRHDDDWVVSSGTWLWQDTEKRAETLYMLDAIPRVLLPFLPGEKWVGEFRVRYVYNDFNDQNTLKLRPRLTYFWFREGSPYMNVFLQYEIYHPLNYGDKDIYEKWLYLGALYHFNKLFKPGLYIARKSLTWTTGADGKRLRATQPYEVTHEATVIGLNLTFRL